MNSFKPILYQITRPVAYLFIKHADKPIYDWWIPGIVTGVAALVCWWLDVDLTSLFRFSDGVSSFAASLPGFFIAALAAIATFNRLDIDKPMAGKKPPTVETLINTQYKDVELSRRRFLCMLFSFLAVQSIFIFLLGLLAQSFSFADLDAGLIKVPLTCAVIYLLVFYFFTIQLLVATMHGMYYLGDRIHY